MPWAAQVCPFCDARYANKTGLRKHLISYTGRWRVPADGVHDVLKIQSLPSLQDHFQTDKILYRCPTCAKEIDSLLRFKEHLFYLWHYGDAYNDNNESAKLPPFDPELYRIRPFQPKGTFDFLRLPLELREMIYKAIMCFERIEFGSVFQRTSVDPMRGVWLQRNPSVNLLALVAVNRQVYNEARQVLYAFNSFIFHDKKALCVFLFGIGSHNASLLRSVKWESDNGKYENHVDMIKAFMKQSGNTTAGPQPGEKTELSIWNNDDQFIEFLKSIRSPGPAGGWDYARRLLRRDSEHVSATDYFYRFIFHIKCYEGKGISRTVRIAYELCSREVKREDPEWTKLFQTLVIEDANKDRERGEKGTV